MAATLSIFIFVLTVLAILLCARWIPEWAAALGGAVAVIELELDSLSSAWHALYAQADVLFFFAGLALATAVAEDAGIFEWLTWRAARWADGSSRRLWFAVAGVACVTTILLTNDAAVLVIAPLAAVMARTLRLPAAPFVLTIAFVANAASAVLPISNPTNFIIAHAAGLNLASYLRAVEVPALAALLAAMCVLMLIFNRPSSERYQLEGAREPGRPETVITIVLALMAGGMIFASALSLAVGTTALAFAAILIVLCACSARRSAITVLRRSHISIVALVAGLFVIVDGLRATGALTLPVRWLSASAGPLTVTLTALLANVFNNLPVSIVVVQILHHPFISPAAATKLAAGSILGLAIGPNLTTIGSLSTILMLIVVRARGVEIAPKDFILPGVAVCAASVLAATAALML
ncbi:MAG: SLC13 family permease [Candidatus Eremiobacteraeota bacterium]|nr:SLC13 family permease [Candidatus Eremiobacteraeota bacterium]